MYSVHGSACPVVLVHGFMGWGQGDMCRQTGARWSYWDTAAASDTNTCGLQVFEASLGPASSFHDRACELFAQIIGTRTDFGEQHSLCVGHSRYGRDFTACGFYPEWSATQPIHLVCHSAGSNTARMLQQLLEEDFWELNTSACWVKSISSVSGALNGSTASYMYGCDEQTGFLLIPRKFMLLMGISNMILNRPENNSQNLFTWKLDHWGISEENIKNLPRKLLRQKLQSQFASSGDNIGYDLTLQGCYKLNGRVKDCSRTYYFSYITQCTSENSLFDLLGIRRGITISRVNPMLSRSARYILRKTFSTPPIPSWGAEAGTDEDWWHNDGLVSTFSQVIPRTNPATRCVSGGSILDTEESGNDFIPGRWYHEFICDLVPAHGNNIWDHSSTTAWRCAAASNLFSSRILTSLVWIFENVRLIIRRCEQQKFYENIYQRLASLK